MNYPVVLVLSSCPQTSALDIIASELSWMIPLERLQRNVSIPVDIRKAPNDDKIHKSDDDSVSYIHDVNTKYYKTQIAFLPVDNTNGLSESVKGSVEGVLIYFDSNDVSMIHGQHSHAIECFLSDIVKTK